MRTSFFLLALVLLPAMAFAQAVVMSEAHPGTRNTSVIYYDDSFLFMSRNFGDQRDPRGNTVPGLFVHSKAHDRWLQIHELSTKDGKFGKSSSEDPEENKRLQMSQVGWDYTAYAQKPSIELPLKTAGSIAFPEAIDFDAKGDRFKLSFYTSWKIESAATRLFLSRKELIEQFDKLAKP
jgi:hypothetical protein